MPPFPTWICCALLFPITGTDPVPPPTPAMTLWHRGQELMRNGDNDKAIPCFLDSLKLDPNLARNHLSLAAAYADQGHDNLAMIHLGHYVAKQPDHLSARLQYADMLYQLQQPKAARVQYERFLADAQEHDELDEEHLVHCHTCLVEIYEASGDAYHEHLNRGLGLYQLACQRAALPDPNGELSVESLLLRAAGELMAARQSRRDEARACWYLHQIWSRLGQKHPATHWLRAAEAAAPLGELTPAETRGLYLAWMRFQQESRK
jgi:tetratricopeptide (TPR) repeat protein